MTSPLTHIFLFLLIPNLSQALSEVFVFKPHNNLEYADNWFNVPCEDDDAKFDAQKIVITMLSQSLKTNMIDLPNDGVIFLDEQAQLGIKGDFQCNKRKSPEDASFHGQVTTSNYYDYRNWKPQFNYSWPRLHAQMVPGSQDTAFFDKTKPVRIEINQIIKVGELFFGDVVSLS
ncbi:hypothetical protein L596_013039 [Steinernema carpocapsae]|uniref:Protein amnionless n=1 Tax=Steinernema carpocapsae TaxID=34508 RepID=A0A4U5NZV5_STECR|nr:hypothetical protein L596_013039 [Steinernema carpocapsae]